MQTVLKTLAILALGLAAATPTAAYLLDTFLAKEVLIITPHAPEHVAMNRQLYVEGDPVPDLYGVPMNEPVRVLFPEPGALIRPTEAPNTLLLAVNKQAAENPFQVRTLWFVTWRVAAGFAIGGFLLLSALFVSSRRRHA